MAKQGFRVLDSDMHVMEPPDLWTRYIDPKFRDIAPVGTTTQITDLRRVLMDYNHWSAIALLGELLPWEDNTVTLDKDVKDQYGLPVARNPRPRPCSTRRPRA